VERERQAVKSPQDTCMLVPGLRLTKHAGSAAAHGEELRYELLSLSRHCSRSSGNLIPPSNSVEGEVE
jgi:hypothetical protein